MKRQLIFAVCLALLLGSGLTGFETAAQSNRGGGEKPRKINRRAPAAEVKPTPPVTDETLEADVTDEEVIEIDTSLVTIPVRVLDRDGRFVSGLTQEDFTVYEDKVAQEIAYFSNEEKPFTVALVLDMSYSSKFKIDEIQQAALQFITELRPDDRVMVVAFDEELHVLCEPTNDRQTIRSAIVKTRISTGTSLYEAVDFVINRRFNKIEGRKAIVLFTDGVDTTSREASDRGNLRDASELDALIYPIHYDTYRDVKAIESGQVVITEPNTPRTTPPIGGGSIPTGGSKSPFPFPLPTGTIGGGGGTQQRRGIPTGTGTTREEYVRGEEYLEQMAFRTGGRVYRAVSPGGLTDAFSRIASELREFYSLGYYPDENKPDGVKRSIKVRVNREKVAVRSRDSYVVRKRSDK